MSVFQQKPYERHFVTNVPNLLAAGNTLADLAVGQIGIFDAKTNRSVTSPTYAANKAIYIAQGTPDNSGFPEGAMIPNIYRKSHLIEGKKVQGLRIAKASRGQGEIVTLGYDGVDTSKTLTGKPGDTFYYWVRLTGEPMFNLMPDNKRGVMIQGAVQLPCPDDCGDNCDTVDCNTIADAIVADWNTKRLPGGQFANQYVSICKVVSCAEEPTLTLVQYDKYCIDVIDDGTQSALGAVQAQYPGLAITRSSRNGITSTYCFTQLATDAAPADYEQAEGTVVPNCSNCPAGATATRASAQFQLKTDGELTAGHLTALQTILTALSGETSNTVTLLQLDTNTNIATYQINIIPDTAAGADADTINDAIVAAATVPEYVVGSTVYVGVTQPYCTLASSTIAWNDPIEDYCARVQVTFTISLADDGCGNDYLTTLQELYATIPVPGGTVSGTVTMDDGSGCVHEYTLTTYSKNCVPANCCAKDVVFPDVPDFGTQAWTAGSLNTAGTAPCVCGVQWKSDFTPRKESECTFGNWARQVDWVHIEASSHNPDWRSTDICEVDPVATRIQNGKYPNGDGPYVARLERADRAYDSDYFYLSPVVREAFNWFFETRLDVYYDMVAVEFDFTYASNDGFGQYDTDRYVQHIWMPESQAGELVTALNTYVASVPIMLDPVAY